MRDLSVLNKDYAIEQTGQVAEVPGADQVRINETISHIQEDAVAANETAQYLR